MKQYDVVVDNQFGIMRGRNKLVFIKTGRGGTINGYENKYLNICGFLADRYGYSFVVSSNPVDSVCNLQIEINQINEYVGDYDEIFYIGVSNGASVGAEQCWKIDLIKNALLINGPLMINWPKSKAGAERFKGQRMLFVYGNQDPSFRYVELIDFINNDACKRKVIEGEGHRLADDTFRSVLLSFLDDLQYGEN